MLLDLTCSALASQSRVFVLVEQFNDDVLACSKVLSKRSGQLIIPEMIRDPAEALPEPHSKQARRRNARSSYNE
jgi:hypothetical protein